MIFHKFIFSNFFHINLNLKMDTTKFALQKTSTIYENDGE